MIILVKDEDDIGGLSCPLAKRGYIAGIRNRNCHISFISNNSRSLWPLLVGNCQKLVKYHNEDNNNKDNNNEYNYNKDNKDNDKDNDNKDNDNEDNDNEDNNNENNDNGEKDNKDNNNQDNDKTRH